MKRFKYYFYQFTGIVIRLFVRIFLNFRVITKHKRLLKHTGILVVANHQSLLDPPLIGAYLYELYASYFAKAELFKVPVLRTIISLLNAFPVKRGESDIESIRKAIDTLNNRGVLVMFPEGTRTLDGSIHPFKKGVGYLVEKTKCAVQPVYMGGFFKVFPKYGRKRLRYPSRIVIGRMLSYEEINARIGTGNRHEEIADILFDEVNKLSLEV